VFVENPAAEVGPFVRARDRRRFGEMQAHAATPLSKTRPL
jgi:hypothetical protein